MTTKVLDFSNIDRKLFWTFALALGFSLAFYLYAVLVITVSGVERERTASAARNLSAETGNLEAEYLSLQNSITLSYAEKELGFKEVAVRFTNENVGNKLSMAQ
jgi:hypothetical protein